MRKIIRLLQIILLITLVTQGVQAQYVYIINQLKQKNSQEFPLLDSYDLKGGAMTGSDRTALSTLRRVRGQLFMDSDDDKLYQLIGGVADGNWQELGVWPRTGNNISYSPGDVAVGHNLKVSDTIRNEISGSKWGKIKIDATDIKIGYNTVNSANIWIGGSTYHKSILDMPIPGTNNILMGTDCSHDTLSGSANVLIGLYAGYNLKGGSNNIFLGQSAGEHSSSGIHNFFAGYQSGNGCNGQYNIGLGYAAGYNFNLGTPYYNVILGRYAGYYCAGNNNIFIGNEAGYRGSSSVYNNNIMMGELAGRDGTGNANIYLGKQAGQNNDGSYNIFIGDSVGYGRDVNKRLFIDCEATNYPLLDGNFTANTLQVNGALYFTDKTMGTASTDSIMSRSGLKVKLLETDAIENNDITWTGLNTFSALLTYDSIKDSDGMYRHIVVRAGEAEGGSTAPANVELGSFMAKAFDADAEVCYFSFRVPNDWDGASDMYLIPYWFAESGDVLAEGETVIWKAERRSVAVGEAYDNGTLVTETNTTTGGAGGETDKELFKTKITIDYDNANQPLAKKDILGFKFYRDKTNDTYSGDAQVVLWLLTYKSVSMPDHQ